jgi:hypothetical protein
MDAVKQVTDSNSPSQHTEAQKQHLYNNLPAEERVKKSYSEWVREAYQEQYEKWVPWLEDQYLKWFGNGDNKASYATKGISTPCFTVEFYVSLLVRVIYIGSDDVQIR